MTATLLVDLDDTLLGNKMETFIPAYLQALGIHTASLVPPEIMVKAMLKATQSMFENRLPDRTLKSCFDSVYYPAIGLDEADLVEQFDHFFSKVFPTLKDKTHFKPNAVKFIKAGFARGFNIGIATNPVFPHTAIIQRLEWAGLPPRDFDFLFIPSYETFHFVKPNPAYFAEFLTIIGWPQDTILMIGNDPDHDICGSREIGIPVFWISNGKSEFPIDQPSPDGSGSLDDFYSWLDGQQQENLKPNFSSTSASSAILRGSPAGLSTLVAEIPANEWAYRSDENEWSLTEIVCHLRDVEREINLPRLRTTLNETNPFIPGVDSDTWADERDYRSQDGNAAFRDFVDCRIETLTILDQLNEEDWLRPIRHAIFGPTDLKEIVHIMASHERLHDRQIYEVLHS
jgi:FMN phosphatase YigB (HAD superfamily)